MKFGDSDYMRQRLEMYRAGLNDITIAEKQCVEIGSIVCWRVRHKLPPNNDNVRVTRCGFCVKHMTDQCPSKTVPAIYDYCSHARRKA